MIIFLFLVVAACALVSLGFFWGLRKFVQNAEDRSYDEGYEDGFAAARQESGEPQTSQLPRPVPRISGAITQPLIPPLRR